MHARTDPPPLPTTPTGQRMARPGPWLQQRLLAVFLFFLLLLLGLLPAPSCAATASSGGSNSSISSSRSRRGGKYEEEVGLSVRPAPGKVAYGIMVYQRANKTVAEVQAQFEVRAWRVPSSALR